MNKVKYNNVYVHKLIYMDFFTKNLASSNVKLSHPHWERHFASFIKIYAI